MCSGPLEFLKFSSCNIPDLPKSSAEPVCGSSWDFCDISEENGRFWSRSRSVSRNIRAAVTLMHNVSVADLSHANKSVSTPQPRIEF